MFSGNIKSLDSKSILCTLIPIEARITHSWILKAAVRSSMTLLGRKNWLIFLIGNGSCIRLKKSTRKCG